MKSHSKIKYRLFFGLFLTQLTMATYANDKPRDINTIIALANQYCGSCHKAPPPALLPKKDWPRVIQLMIKFSDEKMGKDYLSPDAINDITAYYYGSSPTELPRLSHNKISSKLNFAMHEFGEKSKIPVIVNIRAVNLDDSKDLQFLVCDAEKKQLTLLKKSQGKWQEEKLAEIEVPIFTDIVDYDGDGDKDIIVTDLGIFPPSKKMVGRVFLLRRNKDGKFEKETLIGSIPRATEARALDIDGDGDLDLAVSAFGGENIGEVFWLENQGNGKNIKHTLLNLSGALNIIPIDLNGDGKIDFISLISQEHEMIMAFIATENKEFRADVIAQAPHPMFGLTGLRMVDLDNDGDSDILFSNGDAFDTQTDPKPYHGVQWLENKGNLVFKFREIGRSYGIASAVAGDIDGDGDLDIVASSFMNYWEDEKRKSLVWFENDGAQHFTQHNFVNPPPGIVSFELKDFTGDGKLDIIAGVFRMDLLMLLMSNDHKKIEAMHKERVLSTRFIFLNNVSILPVHGSP